MFSSLPHYHRSSNSDRTANYLGLGTSNGRAKVITLQIRGLHQATRKICEEQLLRVKGVISFTFNITKARCTVRVKANVQAQKLCEAISETKIMSAQQIVKNESGEEVGAIVLFLIKHASASGISACSRP